MVVILFTNEYYNLEVDLKNKKPYSSENYLLPCEI